MSKIAEPSVRDFALPEVSENERATGKNQQAQEDYRVRLKISNNGLAQECGDQDDGWADVT